MAVVRDKIDKLKESGSILAASMHSKQHTLYLLEVVGQGHPGVCVYQGG